VVADIERGGAPSLFACTVPVYYSCSHTRAASSSMAQPRHWLRERRLRVYEQAPGCRPGPRVMTNAQARGDRVMLSIVNVPLVTVCPRPRHWFPDWLPAVHQALHGGGVRARDALTRAESLAAAAAAAASAADATGDSDSAGDSGDSVEITTRCSVCMTLPEDTALNCGYVHGRLTFSSDLCNFPTCVFDVVVLAAGTYFVATAPPKRPRARCARVTSPYAFAFTCRCSE